MNWTNRILCRTTKFILASFLCLFLTLSAFTVPANASLILTIDNYTTNQLAFTISGTLDTATAGEWPGYLAVKNDWSNNIGTHTELFNFIPLVSGNITIGGTPAGHTIDTGPTKGDAIAFYNPSGVRVPIPAGTAVAGSIVLYNDTFNPVTNNSIQLLSGLDLTPNDWNRLEANATLVPIPSAVWLLGSGLIGIVGVRRKFKK